MVRIPQALVDRVFDHAARAWPEECCGVLIGRRHHDVVQVSRLIEAENIAEGDRRRSYQIDWRSLFTAFRGTRDGGDEVVGFYHSHPEGSAAPSARDVEEAWPGFCYLIAHRSEWRCTELCCWLKPGDGSGRAGLTAIPVDIQG